MTDEEGDNPSSGIPLGALCTHHFPHLMGEKSNIESAFADVASVGTIVLPDIGKPREHTIDGLV